MKSPGDLDQMEDLFRTSLACYVSAVATIENYQVEADRKLLQKHRRRLKHLRKKVTEDPTVPTLQQSSDELKDAVKEYSAEVGVLFRGKQQEIRRILSILAEAADTLSSRSYEHAAQLRELSRDLEATAQMEGLSEIRQRLTRDVGLLKERTEAMHRVNQASAMNLRFELKSFQQRLETAELLAATDALTGLPNRREAERLIVENVGGGYLFSIMLFDLDSFKSVNDSHGHAVGDQVLRLFARRLAQQFRAGDVACRWGGDEFVVVVRCPLEDTLAMARRAAASLCGPYVTETASGEVMVHQRASVGVAEHRPGETGDELFARADASMYENKAAVKAS